MHLISFNEINRYESVSHRTIRQKQIKQHFGEVVYLLLLTLTIIMIKGLSNN